MYAVEDIAEFMGGEVVLGRPIVSREQWIQAVRSGLPFAALERVMVSMALSRTEIEFIMALPSRTFSRRKDAHVLRAEESDRLLRLARVAVHATAALGSMERAAAWLHRPNRSLGGQAPVEMLDTDLGVEHVDHTLTHLEHGIVG